MSVRLAEVTDQPIDPTRVQGLVASASSGALCLFVGTVRDNDLGAEGEVVGLDYTCHPAAGALIGQIVAAQAAVLDPEGQCDIAAVHRIGHLPVGEVAFVAAVASPHRQLAFQLCAQVVDAVKEQLPIWKQQFEADGRSTWTGLDLPDGDAK